MVWEFVGLNGLHLLDVLPYCFGAGVDGHCIVHRTGFVGRFPELFDWGNCERQQHSEAERQSIPIDSF